MKRSARILSILSLAFTSMFMSSCETEVDLFSEESDVAVIYALLDQNDSVQYFRINPTFIGEGDARTLAGDTLLTNYPANSLLVRLYDLSLGDDVYYEAEETSEVKLEEEGIFDPNIRMFKLNTPIYDSAGILVNSIIKPNRDYKLWVFNPASGNTYTSEIAVGDINDLQLTSPSYNPSPQFSSNWIKFRSLDNYNEFSFKISTFEGADRYRMDMIYYYYYDSDSTKDNFESISFRIGEYEKEPGATSLSFPFNGEIFYATLLQRLAPMDFDDPSTIRTGEYFDIVVTAMGTDLNNYVEVSNITSTGLSQERPEYTNINNGLGVFSTYSKKKFAKIFMDNASWEELVGGQYTNDRFKCGRRGATGQKWGNLGCSN